MTTETAWVWDQENRCCFRAGTLRVHLTVDDESGDPENAPEWVVTKDIVGRIVRDHNLAAWAVKAREALTLIEDAEEWGSFEIHDLAAKILADYPGGAAVEEAGTAGA